VPKKIVVDVDAAGLYSNHDPVNKAPPGALAEAADCVISRPGVISKRRGFKTFLPQLSSVGEALVEFKNTLLVLDSTTLKWADGAAWSSYTGTFSAPADHRMRGVEDRRSLFLTTDMGVQILEGLDEGTYSPVRSGVPKPGGANKPTVFSGSGSVFSGAAQIAYRAVLMRLDDYGREVRSAPSDPMLVVNTSGTQDVTVRVVIPDEDQTGDVIELYRTAESFDATTPPGDEMRLVLTVGSSGTEGALDSIVDDVPEAFLGVPLYTNQTQNGILQANGRPANVVDLARYRGHLFGANGSREQSLTVQLVPGGHAIAATDTITFGAETYEFQTAIDVGAKEFLLATSGTPSENLRDTMLSLCECITRQPSGAYYADYISGPSDAPGIIRVFARDLGTAAFHATANDGFTGQRFVPVVPASGTTFASMNDAQVNALYHSRFEIPDAWPLANIDLIGSDESEILRLLTTRDSLFILKKEGVYRLSGDSEQSFDIDLQDPSVRLLAPDTAVVLDNAVFALTNQGVVRLNESGTSIVSWPIQNIIQQVMELSGFKTKCHAVANESEHSYILFVPEVDGDSTATVAYVYNYLTNAWTGPWQKECKASHVLFGDNLLYLADATGADIVLQERKSLDETDYSDEDTTVDAVDFTDHTVDSDGNSVLTLNYSYPGMTMRPGFLVTQGLTKAKVDAVSFDSGSTWELTLDGDYDHAGRIVVAEDVTLSLPIQSRVEWLPKDAGSAATMKHFGRAQVYLESDRSQNSQLGFSSDENPTEEQVGVITVADGSKSTPLSTHVPRQHQRCRTLSVSFENNYAGEHFHILSVSVSARAYGDRTSLVAR